MKSSQSGANSQPTYSDYLRGTAEILEKSQSEVCRHEVEILGQQFVIFPNVFSPKYFLDTAFFARDLPIREGERFLEIGSGSGVTAIFAVYKGAGHVTAIDINPDAVANTNENVVLHEMQEKITVLHGDLYDPLSESDVFDTIYWNTPFGFVDAERKLSLLEKAVYDPGYVSTKRFIFEAQNYLSSEGRLLIGFSETLGRFDILQKMLEEAGFFTRLVSRIESEEVYPVSFEIYEAIL